MYPEWRLRYLLIFTFHGKIKADEYLVGRYHLARRTSESILQANKAFRAAIADDPHYSPAYSALAITLAVTPYYRGVGSLPELVAEAKDLAHQAIGMDT